MKPPRNPESGYALLLIYAMAAAVAIMLYMQLPRVAFEAQRNKEQLLIDRGQQYSRAVQLYVRKFQRFPQNFEALENTQNIRFLRKQYVDPMTGKNEWRIIHVGPGGTFIDSQVFGNQQKKVSDAPTNFITELQPTGGTGTTGGAEGVNPGLRRRPSDPALPQGDPTTVNGPVMVLPDGRIVPATPTGIPAPPAPAAPPAPTPGQPGAPLPGGIPGFQPGQIQNQANQPNIPPGGAAANLINQILTTPRPQPGQGGQGSQGGVFDPATGLQAPQAGAGPGLGGQIVGGGMAGVASKYEQDGIKIYHDRSAYNQWEFVYDMSKDPARTGGRGGIAPAPAAGTVTPASGATK